MKTQNGNALFLILIAVALFAALSYAITQSDRGGSGINKEQAHIQAAQMLQNMEMLNQSITRLRIINSCPIEKISFETADTPGSHNPDSPADGSCMVFDQNGGGMEPVRTPFDTAYGYNGNNRIAGMGCDDIDPACSELVVSASVPEAVCLEINNIAGIENPNGAPPQLKDWASGAVYTGTFVAPSLTIGGDDATNEAPEVKGKSAGCVHEFDGGANNNNFYYVLDAR